MSGAISAALGRLESIEETNTRKSGSERDCYSLLHQYVSYSCIIMIPEEQVYLPCCHSMIYFANRFLEFQ
jgi:hypothetical protein